MTQQNRETLLALADRCEKATGGDRELDAAIAVALGFPNGPHEIVEYESRSVIYIDEQAGPFTASLDAAMSLMPKASADDAIFWQLGNDAEGGSPADFKARILVATAFTAKQFIAIADTPALALCAASLRATASSLDEPCSPTPITGDD